MRRLLNKKTRYITLIVILGITLLSIGLSPLVKINYDMRLYLPEDSRTKETTSLMEEEFGNTSMVQIMTTNLSIENASRIVYEIEKLDNVKSVLWLATVADLSIPLENLDQELLAGFYDDGKLLLTVEFMEDDYSLLVGDALDNIKSLLKANGINAHYRGAAVQNASSRSKMNTEMLWILLITVPIAIIILFLASYSWFEPVIVLINLGVAIIINLGTNYMLSSVSYVTIAIASILQLAMSLDYSLFLIHRYYEQREAGLDVIDAAVKSTKDAFSTVTASALTTIFGFLALLFMSYKIGTDIGLALAKSIVISYLVTLIFLPLLLVFFDKLLLKLKRKKVEKTFERTANFFKKYRLALVIGLVVIGGVGFYLQTKADYLYGDATLLDEADPLVIDENAITEHFGAFQPVVILYRNEDTTNAIALAESLMQIEEVSQIQSLVTSIDPAIPENIIPAEALKQFKGENYSRMIVYLDILEETDRMYEVSGIILDLISEHIPGKTYALGIVTAITEIKETVDRDGIIVQIISAIVIALVIGIIMKSPLLPLLLVLLIEISIWINVSITSLSGGSVVYIGYLVFSSLQLGATIDYAVLLTSRYQEFRGEMDKFEAIKKALVKSVPAIITSAVVLAVAGFVEAIVSQLSIVKEIGLLIGRGALLSGVLVIFILPALLLVFDNPIQKSIIKTSWFKKFKKKGAPSE